MLGKKNILNTWTYCGYHLTHLLYSGQILGRLQHQYKLKTHFEPETQFSLYHMMPDRMVLAGLGSSAVFE